MVSSKHIRALVRTARTTSQRRLLETLAKSSPLFQTARGLTSLQQNAGYARFEAELIRDLTRAARGSGPIVVGPWLSEVGFEVLYWVPFLRWCLVRFGIDPARLIVISRGGPAGWYGGLHARYVEIFDLITPAEFKARNDERIAETRLQKQVVISGFERDLVARAGLSVDGDSFWLHPRYMYRLFQPFWDSAQPLRVIDRFTSHEPQPRPARPEFLGGDDYVAMKVYFNDSFPDTAENRAFVDALIKRLAQRHRVVLLNTGLTLDDHGESGAGASDGAGAVIEAAAHMRPQDNLDVQTRIVANARAFYGTYGGFSYLAPYYGVPSSAFHSAEEKAAPLHLDVANLAVRRLRLALHGGSGIAPALRGGASSRFPDYAPSFVSLSTQGFEALQQTL